VNLRQLAPTGLAAPERLDQMHHRARITFEATLTTRALTAMKGSVSESSRSDGEARPQSAPNWLT
jgi:hypothetical protein